MTDVEILEMTYNDICTVERNVKIKDPITGVTTTKLVKVYENIKGALSKTDSQNQILNTSNDVATLVYSHKLFTSPVYEIIKGDIVTINQIGKITSYLASDGFLYPSHTETPVTYKGRA